MRLIEAWARGLSLMKRLELVYEVPADLVRFDVLDAAGYEREKTEIAEAVGDFLAGLKDTPVPDCFLVTLRYASAGLEPEKIIASAGLGALDFEDARTMAHEALGAPPGCSDAALVERFLSGILACAVEDDSVPFRESPAEVGAIIQSAISAFDEFSRVLCGRFDSGDVRLGDTVRKLADFNFSLISNLAKSIETSAIHAALVAGGLMGAR